MNPILKYILNYSAFKRVIGDDSKLDKLVKADALLSDLVHKKRVPGISITVLKEGKLVLQKGYGHADKERKIKVDPTKTIFRIASVSKNIAATALASMMEDGTIDIDTSFYEYVPYFPKKEWDFTIRQLAGHTAGIRSYRGIEYGLNKPYSIKESIAIFKDDDLIFEPGTDYLYNSYDWVMISLAMQEVSGIPFEEYVKEKVLNPIGMEHTFAPECLYEAGAIKPENAQAIQKNQLIKSSSKKDLAIFYTKNRIGGFREAIPVNNYYKLAGGGYLSTSEDIAKFGQAYIEGKVLSEELRTLFLTTQTINATPTHYGLGWQVTVDKRGRKYYGHVGNGVGGYSNLFIYPEQQMVFAILINCTDPKVQVVLDEVVDTLIAQKEEQVQLT